MHYQNRLLSERTAHRSPLTPCAHSTLLVASFARLWCAFAAPSPVAILTRTEAVNFTVQTKYCHVYECDYRRGLDWISDLLATCTHDSEL
jgi:hypothetical protein